MLRKMKTYQINPEVSELNLTIQLPIQLLETEGWDFATEHENTSEAFEISIEEAEQYNYNNYSAVLRVHGTKENPLVDWSWYSFERNENLDFEDSGDNEQSIKDIISLLNQGLIEIDQDEDYSVDSNEVYVKSFIQK